MFVESNYLLGLIYLTENNMDRAEKFFKRCVRYSAKKKRVGIKSEEYISTFKNIGPEFLWIHFLHLVCSLVLLCIQKCILAFC